MLSCHQPPSVIMQTNAAPSSSAASQSHFDSPLNRHAASPLVMCLLMPPAMFLIVHTNAALSSGRRKRAVPEGIATAAHHLLITKNLSAA
jgi:hypothetical protein